MAVKKESIKWEKIWEVADAPVFEMGHGTIFCIAKQKELFGYFSKGMLLFARNEVLEAYHLPEDLEEASKFGFSYFRNKERYSKFITSIKQLQENLKEDQILFRKEIDGIDGLRLLQGLLSSTSDKLIEIFAFFNMTNPQFTAGMEGYLVDHLKKYDAPDALSVLTAPVSKSTLHEEDESFYRLLLRYKNILPAINKEAIAEYESFNDELNDHIKAYGHLNGNEGADHWDLQYYLGLINDCLKLDVNLAEKVKELENTVDIARNKKVEFTNKYKLDSEVIYIADCLAGLGHYRLELRILWSVYFRMLRELVYKISKLTQIPAYDLLALSPNELSSLDFSKEGFEVNLKTKDRHRAYLFLVREDKLVKESYGDKAVEEFNRLVPKPDFESIKELEGSTAFPGDVEGVAYCMNWGDKDFNMKVKNMPKGAVLVIGNTRPSLMPAIRKASAIVTDEGGITSHAAIVSRELKIPCVIGTKSATKVIKTGHTIRVNASKGIVEVVE